MSPPPGPHKMAHLGKVGGWAKYSPVELATTAGQGWAIRLPAWGSHCKLGLSACGVPPWVGIIGVGVGTQLGSILFQMFTLQQSLERCNHWAWSRIILQASQEAGIGNLGNKALPGPGVVLGWAGSCSWPGRDMGFSIIICQLGWQVGLGTTGLNNWEGFQLRQ